MNQNPTEFQPRPATVRPGVIDVVVAPPPVSVQAIVAPSVSAQPVIAPVASAPVVEKVIEPVVKRDKRRHFLAAFFLSFMFGMFGVDRFYLGKYGTGLLKLVSFGGFGIWAMVDMSMIMSGAMRDRDDNELIDAGRYKKFAKRFIFLFSFVVVIMLALFVAAIIFTATQFINNGGLDGLMQTLGVPKLESNGGFDANQLMDQIKSLL